MKVLITGSNGQVGSELVSLLKSNVERRNYSMITETNRDVLDLDNVKSIQQFLAFVAPDLIINAAAYTAVDRAENEKEIAFSVNASAVTEIANYCNASGCKLVHISTDYVFDGELDRPYVEGDSTNPASVYGRSKLAGEMVIQERLEEHIILRTSWVFGAKGGNFVKTMLRLAEEKNELRVVADQYGAPTSARAVAQAIAAIIGQLNREPRLERLWGTYHYSGSPFVSWADFAREIFEQATHRRIITESPRVCDICAADFPTPAVRPMNSRLDCSKLQSAFGIEPDDWKRSLGLMLDELTVSIQK
ncbi:dTDP-4-dehydrorhamnose reductase [Luminiphilus sp.]|nr:dTDP-4-dehydrorhamnose reductase [Luminiphilus sp.]